MYASQIGFLPACSIVMRYIRSTVSLAIVMPPSSSSASATLFASPLYLAIFTFLYVTQYDPSILPLQRQHVLVVNLNLGHAYQDLHRVSFLGRAVCGILTSFKQIAERINPYLY